MSTCTLRQVSQMWRMKRICAFEDSVMTKFNYAFRGARDLAFYLKVPLDSLLVWASSGGSGETARMRRLAWTFAARIDDKYQIHLTWPKYKNVPIFTTSQSLLNVLIGCDVTLTSSYGMLFTPGYVGGIKYPNNVMCSWTINADEPISIYFESDLQLVDDHRCIRSSNDYLKV